MEYVAQRNFLRRGYTHTEKNISEDRRAHPVDYEHARILDGRSTEFDFLTWDGTSSQTWQRFINSTVTEPDLYENRTDPNFKYQRTGPIEDMKREMALSKIAWQKALNIAIETSQNSTVFEEDDENSDGDTYSANPTNTTWSPTYEEIMNGEDSDDDSNDGETIYSIVEKAESLEKLQTPEEENEIDDNWDVEDTVYWPAPKDSEDDSDDSEDLDTATDITAKSSENTDTGISWFSKSIAPSEEHKEENHRSGSHNSAREYIPRSAIGSFTPTLAQICEEDEEQHDNGNTCVPHNQQFSQASSSTNLSVLSGQGNSCDNGTEISSICSESANTGTPLEYESFDWADKVINASLTDGEASIDRDQESERATQFSDQEKSHQSVLVMTATEDKLFHNLEEVLELVNYDLVSRGQQRRLGDWSTFLQYNPRFKKVEWAQLERKYFPQFPDSTPLYTHGYPCPWTRKAITKVAASIKYDDASQKEVPYLLVTDSDTGGNFELEAAPETLRPDHLEYKQQRDAVQVERQWQLEKWRKDSVPKKQGQCKAERDATAVARRWWKEEQRIRDLYWMAANGCDLNDDRLGRDEAYADKQCQSAEKQKKAFGEKIERIKKVAKAMEEDIRRLMEENRQKEETNKENLRIEEERNARIEQEKAARIRWKREAREARQVSEMLLHARRLLPEALQYETKEMETKMEEIEMKAKEKEEAERSNIRELEKVFSAQLFLQMAEMGLDRNESKEMEMAMAKAVPPMTKTDLKPSEISQECALKSPRMIFTSPDLEVTFFRSPDFLAGISSHLWDTAQQWNMTAKARKEEKLKAINKKDVELTQKWWEMERRMTAMINNQRDGVTVRHWK